METNTSAPVVPEIWGQAARDKRKAHYSRLTAKQARKKANMHKKRLDQMNAMSTRLKELGVWETPTWDFLCRIAFETACRHYAQTTYWQRKEQTLEMQLESQRGYQLPSPV